MDLSTIIAAAIVAVPSTVGLILSARVNKVAKDTHRQVVTLNESTIGELAANTETRRVEDVPYEARTAQEQRHVDTAPEVGPPQGPPR